MISVWNYDVNKPSFEELKQDVKTDVLIIGGGIAGILCAYMLQKSGVDCIITEQSTICSGVTQNTTAKITCQHGAIYDELIRKHGKEVARLYFESQDKALQKYFNMCKSIECDFEKKSSFVYSKTNTDKIEKEVNALNSIGCNAYYHNKTPLPITVKAAVEVKNQAQFNVLKFIYSVASNLKIYENTKVIELTQTGAKTHQHNITADKIIVATHFPFVNKYGGYFIKMYQHRSYVSAFEKAQDVKGMYVDCADDGLSFRNYKNLLLIGGAGHRTGKKGGGWNELNEFANKNYKSAKLIFSWATQDCKTLDNMAYIGQYSKSTPNIYVATGFNKWGMTTAMSAAMILTDLIQGKQNDYAGIFNPSRSVLHGQLIVNTLHSMIGLLTPTVPRCPHLGCALKYNKQEHSWDCSCHGSRFSEDGKLLNNPATSDKQF